MKKIQIITSLGLILAMLGILVWPFAQVVQAGAITSASNTMSRVRVNVLSNHEIRFVTPTGLAAGQTITVSFPATPAPGFTMPAFALANFDFAASTVAAIGCPAATVFTERPLAATATALTWGVAQSPSPHIITFTSGTDTIPVNACIRIRIGSNAVHELTGVKHITNPTVAGSYTITIGGTFGSSGSIVVHIITDDQVVVTARIREILTFSISDNTVGFGDLSHTVSRFSTGDLLGSATEVEAHNLIAATNASAGYVITIGGTTLTSGAHTITAIGATNVASAPGTEQFGVRATATGGIGAVSAPYAAAGFALVLTTNEFASAPGASAPTTFSVRYLANIASFSEAGIYTSVLTYIATATF